MWLVWMGARSSTAKTQTLLWDGMQALWGCDTSCLLVYTCWPWSFHLPGFGYGMLYLPRVHGMMLGSLRVDVQGCCAPSSSHRPWTYAACCIRRGAGLCQQASGSASSSSLRPRIYAACCIRRVLPVPAGFWVKVCAWWCFDWCGRCCSSCCWALLVWELQA